MVRPLGPELAYEHHDLAKTLVCPAWREGLAEACVRVTAIDLSFSSAVRRGGLVDAKL